MNGKEHDGSRTILREKLLSTTRGEQMTSFRKSVDFLKLNDLELVPCSLRHGPGRWRKSEGAVVRYEGADSAICAALRGGRPFTCLKVSSPKSLAVACTRVWFCPPF